MSGKKSFWTKENIGFMAVLLLFVLIGGLVGINETRNYYSAQLNEVANEFCQARSYRETFPEGTISAITQKPIECNGKIIRESVNCEWDETGGGCQVITYCQIPFTSGIYKDGKFLCFEWGCDKPPRQWDENLNLWTCDTNEIEGDFKPQQFCWNSKIGDYVEC